MFFSIQKVISRCSFSLKETIFYVSWKLLNHWRVITGICPAPAWIWLFHTWANDILAIMLLDQRHSNQWHLDQWHLDHVFFVFLDKMQSKDKNWNKWSECLWATGLYPKSKVAKKSLAQMWNSREYNVYIAMKTRKNHNGNVILSPFFFQIQASYWSRI